MAMQSSASIDTGSVQPVEFDVSRARASSLGFLQSKIRRLSKLSIGSSRPADGSDSATQSNADFRGPLGLNLLHEPADPQIEFIFIHGLGGGSRKTWSLTREPGMFWPKEWLPNEPGFKDVRIFSYGYNSDWTLRKESRLTVHDFGQALLADLHNSPFLRRNGDTPIVLVAHSMGGLVAKKVYLLATRDPTYGAIARRIHAMYFLATPHRGSDWSHFAKLVCRSAGYGSKAFLDELIPGSSTLNQINDEFRHVCEDLRLWSFTESVPTSSGLSSSLVVEKESAVLGLLKERVQYINANHRNICKFDSPVNSNYLILQRSFLATVEDIGTEISCHRREEYRLQMKTVSSLLQVDQRPDAILMATNEKQHHGTCQWLTDNNIFQNWVHYATDHEEGSNLSAESSEEQPPNILWLNGRPGTGKSVAAGHIIRYLQELNLSCSFYFFEQNDKSGSTVSSFLRSLAFQMAESNFEVRQAIVSMAKDGIRVNHSDHRMLWTRIFVERILKLEQTKPHYWVMDALDECSDKGISTLVSMISSLHQKTPIRIFITSRPGGMLGRLLALEMAEFSEITTGQEGSRDDIQNLVKARCLQASDGKPYQDLADDIIAKSNGIFLWASLTVERLENVYSVEDKQDILRQIPAEMDLFYSRIIDEISQSPSSELAKCVVKWTVCAPRPLNIEELEEAVKLDIGRTLTASAGQLESMTGHLVFVDNQCRIHITHQTASAFLTQRKEGFRIDCTAAHSRLAEICLDVLCGADFAPPRLRRRGGTTKSLNTLSPLSDYSTFNFSYHIAQSSLSAGSLLISLNKFLRSNILTWVERAASSGDFWSLQLTAQRLKTCLGRQAKDRPSLSVETRSISAWATDIHHIVAAFNSSLLTSPSSIHYIIPRFCPLKSTISQLFAKESKWLKVVGPLEEDWNDRLACYLFQDRATAISYCSRLLAVGLFKGKIELYHVSGSSAFSPAGTLNHGQMVRNLCFNRSSSLLASCSARKLTLWDICSGNTPEFRCVWSKNTDFTPSHLGFNMDESSITLADYQRSSIVEFQVEDGQRGEFVLLHASPDSESSDEGSDEPPSWTPAERIRLDPDLKLAAMSYRNAPVSIWDLDSVEKIGNFEKEGCENIYCTPPPLDMIFNPVAELELLAISYTDNDIVTCNPWTLEQVNKCTLQAAYLHTLAASSDGRVLAGGAGDGRIYLFSFGTLQLLYQIERLDEHLRIHDIVFSADDLRIFDIRGRACNTWAPSILARKGESVDGFSESHHDKIVSPEPPTSLAHAFRWGEAITAIEHTAQGTFLFVGRQDGTIDICEPNTGGVVEKLKLHNSFTEIQHMDWNEEQKYLLSVDNTGRHIVTRLSLAGKDTKSHSSRLLDHQERGSVRQVFLGVKAEYLLTHTKSSVKVMRLDGNILAEDTSLLDYWWMRHPSNSSCLVGICGNNFYLFEWCSLKKLSEAGGIPYPIADPPTSALGTAPWVTGERSGYFAQGVVRSPLQTVDLAAFDASKLTTDTNETELHVLRCDSLNIMSLLGCLKSSLFFLDTGGWVCSISLKNLSKATHYTRHFFIPLAWRTGANMVTKIVSKTVVAFGRGEQLFVFHGFLEFEEKVALQGAMN